MTKWFNQAVINYTYSDYEGYSDRKELAALRLLLKRAESFDEAVFTYNAAENSVCDCYDVLKGALGIAAKRAKGYDDNIFVMARSEFGTEQYIKAMEKAEKFASCELELKRIGRINAVKSGELAKARATI